MRRIRLAQFPGPIPTVLRAVDEGLGRGTGYLVGGAVRDVILRRPVDELDVAVPAGACARARRIAERAGGSYVELDAERGAARAIVPVGGTTVQIDVTDFRGRTLAVDLAHRDFTINALAVPVHDLVRRGSAATIDECRGLADLAARRLRLTGRASIADDPARALRGIRLECALRFRLDAEAARAIRRDAGGLRQVAAERIGQELAEILKLPGSAAALRRAERLGVLAVLTPEIAGLRGVSQPAPHRFDVLEHSLRAVAAADRLVARARGLSPHGAALAAHLAEPLGGGLTRRETLKLAALLHDVSKPETRALVDGRIRFFAHDVLGAKRAREIGERLRLPAGAVRVIETLVRHHLRLMHLEQVGDVTRRARYRFFRDLGTDARDLLLLALADAAAVSGVSPLAVWRRSRLVRDLMAGWQEARGVQTAPALLRGEDVMAAFGLAPGPEVGRLLGLAREAQDLGVVTTRDEALAHVRAARAREHQERYPGAAGSVV